jgi:DNA-binding transcriptional MerR regulator
MRIGQLARESGVSAKTLRYYEEIDLLRPAGRTTSGYRLYDDKVIQRLRFVRRAQTLGLSLADIRAILEISDEGRTPCEHVLGIVDRELKRIAAQVRRLRELRSELRDLRARLAGALESGSARPGQDCPCFENDGQ